MGSHAGSRTAPGNVLTRPSEPPGTCWASTITPEEAEWRAIRCTPLPGWYIAAARAWDEYLGHAAVMGEEITVPGLARCQLGHECQEVPGG